MSYAAAIALGGSLSTAAVHRRTPATGLFSSGSRATRRCLETAARRLGRRSGAGGVSVCSAVTTQGIAADELKCELLGNENGVYSLQGEMLLDADPDSVYNMLTDYEASTRVFRTIKEVETRREEDGVLVVTQQCEWRFLLFGGTFPCHIAVNEDPANRSMVCKLHQKGFVREFEGSWVVTPVGYGRVHVQHNLKLRPSLTPPYAHKIFIKQITAILEDVKAEVESWNDGDGGYPVPATREKEKECLSIEDVTMFV